jgi:DNA polymerase I-like protein with 3'-5' exonuclease and polymerase domains
MNIQRNKIYYFLDFETTTEGGVDKDSPEAQWINNEVLAFYCLKRPATAIHNSAVYTDLPEFLAELYRVASSDEFTPVIVAHNAKFDIKWLIRRADQFCFYNGKKMPWHMVDVWDTMTAEYYLSGHLSKFMSIEKCNDAYGIPNKKTLDLKQHFADGYTMRDIPQNELDEYVKNDVLMLQKLFDAQVEWAVSRNIQVPDMSYIVILALMEYNGLPVDAQKACRLASEKIKEIEKAQFTMRNEICSRFKWVVYNKKLGSQDITNIDPIDDFNEALGTKSKTIKTMSNRILSMLLTGQPEEVKITPKWHLRVTDPYSNLVMMKGKEPTNLGFPMDEHSLEYLSKRKTIKYAVDNTVLPYRKANKLLSTYLMPMLANTKLQGHIYPKLHTTSTATGRLSSSNPNGQNMPEVIRGMIKGPMIEVDFKQLEIHIAAAITGDPQLNYDLEHGLDVHEQTAKGGDRKLAKRVNFGILYGAGVKGLSKQTGEPEDKIRVLMDSFYERYPGVKKWQEQMLHDAKQYAQPHEFVGGGVRRKYCYTTPTGRSLTFIEQKAPDWQRKRTGDEWSFSPQQLSNYPIQSMAGGTVMLEFMPELFNEMPDLTWRMTVHDSLLIDKPKDLTKDEIKGKIELSLAKFKVARPDWNINNLAVDITYHDEHWS